MRVPTSTIMPPRPVIHLPEPTDLNALKKKPFKIEPGKPFDIVLVENRSIASDGWRLVDATPGLDVRSCYVFDPSMPGRPGCRIFRITADASLAGKRAEVVLHGGAAAYNAGRLVISFDVQQGTTIDIPSIFGLDQSSDELPWNYLYPQVYVPTREDMAAKMAEPSLARPHPPLKPVLPPKMPEDITRF